MQDSLLVDWREILLLALQKLAAMLCKVHMAKVGEWPLGTES